MWRAEVAVTQDNPEMPVVTAAASGLRLSGQDHRVRPTFSQNVWGFRHASTRPEKGLVLGILRKGRNAGPIEHNTWFALICQRVPLCGRLAGPSAIPQNRRRLREVRGPRRGCTKGE